MFASYRESIIGIVLAAVLLFGLFLSLISQPGHVLTPSKKFGGQGQGWAVQVVRIAQCLRSLTTTAQMNTFKGYES